MKKKVIKIKINGYDDRTTLCSILAENGHKVWVEEKIDKYDEGYDDYFVCFEIKN